MEKKELVERLKEKKAVPVEIALDMKASFEPIIRKAEKNKKY